jgi:hypothetical protein
MVGFVVFNGDIDGIFMVKSSCLQLEKPLQNCFLEWGEWFFFQVFEVMG